MKAAFYEQYGPPEVVTVRETPKPVPKDNEVLVKVRAASVNSGDARLRSMNVPTGFKLPARLVMGLRRPRNPVLGFELAGEIEAVGQHVTKFKPGDRVFGTGGFALGCHAEYRALREDAPLALMPPNLSFEEAASLCFGGTTALYFFRHGKLKAGETVLVTGGSGTVGIAAIQIARHLGATVSATCSTGNVALVRSLGAAQVFDYTREDIAGTYDVVVDTAGAVSWTRSKTLLNEGGRLLQVLAGLPEMLEGLWGSLRGSRKAVSGTPPDSAEDVRTLAAMAASGALRAVIDSTYPLNDIAEAHRRVDTGRKRGNVVIVMEHGAKAPAGSPAILPP